MLYIILYIICCYIKHIYYVLFCLFIFKVIAVFEVRRFRQGQGKEKEKRRGGREREKEKDRE